MWETLGYIGVDSGTVMFVDPCYVVPDENWASFCSEYDAKEGYDKRYADMSHGGIAVTTAHGDGSYAVEAKRNERGQIIEVRIKFDW